MKNHARPTTNRAHVLWTPKEVATLTDCLEKKIPIKKIADKLGKTEKSIRKKCEWLGLSSATTYRKINGKARPKK